MRRWSPSSAVSRQGLIQDSRVVGGNLSPSAERMRFHKESCISDTLDVMGGRSYTQGYPQVWINREGPLGWLLLSTSTVDLVAISSSARAAGGEGSSRCVVLSG